MRNTRISTTISPKHTAILKKYAEQYGTQQSALEHALESLDNNSKQSLPLTPDEELWLRIGREIKGIGLIQLEVYKFLLSTIDLEGFQEFADQHKMIEPIIEFYYQKPLSEFSLKEVLDAVVATCKFSGLTDSVTYSDLGDHYGMKFMHDMGFNNSKWFKIMLDCLFKSYGVRADITISPRTLFVNVYKNAL